jgi:hypothetical protein
MASFTALYDACTLYPAPLRDLLMHLALTDLFRARWSDQIHDEWIGSVLEDRPDLRREQLERTRALMNAHVRDCYEAGDTFAFVAVVLDCLTDAAKRFYQQWDFAELPGHPYRLFVSYRQLEAMMQDA